ncbi:MAG: stage III sporulation protein AB [Defluviitaleaceae bacterium]|nr:stage III sporulation protein AB [Defluviitaleaceae bacterium]
MMLRIIGALIVLGASTIAGVYYGNLETYRMRDLLEIKKALSILRSHIEYSRTPLPEAMQAIAVRVRKSVGNIFEMCADLLVHERNERVAHIWEAAIEQHKEAMFLTEEDIEQLKGFGAQLGDLDSDAQITNISMLIEYIDERVSQLHESRDRNRKLYRSLGVLGGALIVIIFI